jgi:hypothetical protein
MLTSLTQMARRIDSPSTAALPFKPAAALAVTCLVLGCGGGNSPQVAPPPPNRTFPVSDADRLYRDDRSRMDSVRVAITDLETLRGWWAQATAETPPPKPALPQIDFTREMVLLVSAGGRNQGDRIRVDSVGVEMRYEEGGRAREGWFAVVRTTPDCNPFPGVAYPLEFVRMTRVMGTVEFRERFVPCPGDDGRFSSKNPRPSLTRQSGERSRQLQ